MFQVTIEDTATSYLQPPARGSRSISSTVQCIVLPSECGIDSAKPLWDSREDGFDMLSEMQKKVPIRSIETTFESLYFVAFVVLGRSSRTSTSMRLSPVLASLANVFQIPLRPVTMTAGRTGAGIKEGRTAPTSLSQARISIPSRQSLHSQQSRQFSQTTSRHARKKGPKPDQRVSKYILQLHHTFQLVH